MVCDDGSAGERGRCLRRLWGFSAMAVPTGGMGAVLWYGDDDDDFRRRCARRARIVRTAAAPTPRADRRVREHVPVGKRRLLLEAASLFTRLDAVAATRSPRLPIATLPPPLRPDRARVIRLRVCAAGANGVPSR